MKTLRKEMKLIASSFPLNDSDTHDSLQLDNNLEDGIYFIEVDGTDNTGTKVGTVCYINMGYQHIVPILNFPIIDFDSDEPKAITAIYNKENKTIKYQNEDNEGGFETDCITRFYKLDL